MRRLSHTSWRRSRKERGWGEGEEDGEGIKREEGCAFPMSL